MRSGKNEIIKSICFMISWLLFVVSISDLLLKKMKLSIAECIANRIYSGILYYGIIVLIAGLLFYLCIKLIKNNIVYIFSNNFLNLLFWFIFFFSVVFGYIIKEVYILFWVTCFITTGILIVIKIFKNKKYICDYRNNNENRTHLNKKISLVISSFYVFTLYLYFPYELIFINVDEFGYIVNNVLIITLLNAFFNFVFVYSGYYFVGNNRKEYSLILFWFGISGYIQANFLNGNMTLIDGTTQSWSKRESLLNIIVWAIVFAIVYIIQKRKEKILVYVSFLLTAMQLTSLVVLGFTSFNREDETYYTLTYDGINELGNDENIIVFILDWYDNQLIDMILDEQEDYLDPLNDFIRYKNVTSRFSFTQEALPYLLTGKEREYKEDYKEYIDKAYSEDEALLNVIIRNGYDIGVYTMPQYISSKIADDICNYTNKFKYGCDYNYVTRYMEKSSRYKASPYVLKEMYNYSKMYPYQMVKSNEIFNTTDDIIFYRTIRDSGINIKKDCSKAFRLYHLNGAHAPCYISEDINYVQKGTRLGQSKASLKVVYNYLEELKKAGLYDSANIIITADHGQNTELDVHFDTEYEEDKLLHKYASPILFVKKANQRQQKMNTSEKPITQNDIISTIKFLSGSKEYEEKTIWQIDESINKVRMMEYYRNPDIPYIKYIINGNVANEDNWNVE